MRKVASLVLCFVVGCSLVSVADAARRKAAKGEAAASEAAAPAGKVADVLGVADFDNGAKPNDIGGDFGAWDKDPNDDTQGCREAFFSPGADGKGKCIKLTFDVDSPNPAYNGFWMKLVDRDLRPYGKLVFYVKGDKEAGFTSKMKVELKNGSEVSPYYIDGITDAWQKIELPLKSFKRISDWSKMKELVLVFEDSQATVKSGVIYFDNVSFEK
jgi:hypothetical protein